MESYSLLKRVNLPGGLRLFVCIESKDRPRWRQYLLAGIDVGLSLFLDVARLMAAILIFLFLFTSVAQARSPIPAKANKYKSELIRSARMEFGLDAPVSLLAAQIHQESLWSETAKSRAGALGLAQFMPATANWLPEVAPHVGVGNPNNPVWAIRAMCAYDRWLYVRIKDTHCDFDRWMFVLSGYNGGLGWVNRDRKLASQLGYDPSIYRGHVEMVNAGRSVANIRENRNYPRRIVGLQHRYVDAGWGPGLVNCQ